MPVADEPDPAPRADAADSPEPPGRPRAATQAAGGEPVSVRSGEANARRNGWIRTAMLAVIAIVMLANAAGWVDPDLWIPFVCIIAVMGIGTRGGPLESPSFVAIEALVVLLLGVATFSGSRDFVWAASVGVSLVAIGKVAYLEAQRREAGAAERSEASEPRRALEASPPSRSTEAGAAASSDVSTSSARGEASADRAEGGGS